MNATNLSSHIEGLQALEAARGCELKMSFNAVQAGELRRLLPPVLQDAAVDGKFPSVETLFLAMLQSVAGGTNGGVATDEAKQHADGILHLLQVAAKSKGPRAEKKPKAKK